MKLVEIVAVLPARQSARQHTSCCRSARGASSQNLRPEHPSSASLLQARLAEEAERLAQQQRAAAEAQERAAATLRAVEEDIDEETETLKAKYTPPAALHKRMRSTRIALQSEQANLGHGRIGNPASVHGSRCASQI